MSEFTIDLNNVEKHCETIYEAVIVTAKRARHIHDRMSEELKKQLGEVENEEDLENEVVDRAKIVGEFDKRDKPGIAALNEYIDGKLHLKKE
ncbi:DNA-directed RNA polymerase subunit omega [candidate division KSB1 bacterium]